MNITLKHELVREGLKLAVASEADYDRIIEPPDPGSVIRCYNQRNDLMIFVERAGSGETLLKAVEKIDYAVSNRTGGMQSISRTFGAMPRRVLRADFCHESAIAREMPEQNHQLRRWASLASMSYSYHAPGQFRSHWELVVGSVRPEWVIRGTPFTSGIVNKANALRYHRDAGNFDRVWSVMVALQENMDGGLLVMPEYRVAFRFEGCCFIGFDGQAILHGVTPLVKRSPAGYRYSVVYYSLKQMAKCGSVDQELLRIQELKTKREIGRKRA